MKKIYINGNFITLENDNIEALATENDKIIKTGSKAEILELAEANTEIIDLNGNTLMPSFIDAHSHIFALAKSLMQISIDGLTSIEEIKNCLDKYKKENQTDEWIIVNGYDNNILKNREHITKQELDEIFPDTPVIIENKSRHNGIANSEALEKLGITKTTADPEGGRIIFDTGLLEENAFIDSLKKIPLPKIEEIMNAFKEAQEIYASHGITMAQEGVITNELAKIYKLLADKHEIFLDVVAYMDYINVDEIKKEYSKFINKYNNNFKIGGIKIFLDGSPQAKTAWLREAYANEPEYYGYRIMQDEDVEEILENSKESNLQILAHCNGDKAAEQYINAIKKVSGLKRPVMIHAQLLGLDQLPDVKKYNIIPSFFISHIYYFGDIHIKNLGIKRAEHISPAGSSLKQNILFTFHQDTPVIEPDMFETIWCAVNRITRDGKLLGEDEKISILEAIKAVTINSAYQYGEEGIKGTLKAGKKADLIIVDKNPLKVAKDELRNIKILETIKDGKVIWKI